MTTSGINIRQTADRIVFRSALRDSGDAKVITGIAELRLYCLQDDGSLLMFDWDDFTFKTTPTTALVSMTHQVVNATNTGLWTHTLSNVLAFTVGKVYIEEVSHSSASPQDQDRAWQWGGVEGDQVSQSDIAGFVGFTSPETETNLLPQYASVAQADAYFSGRLYAGVWTENPTEDRNKALVTATRSIDRLAFVGEKNAAWLVRDELGGGKRSNTEEETIETAGLTQALEFPRGADTSIPEDIKIACYEIAIELLDGRDVNIELENLTRVSEGFASARSTFDTTLTHEHLVAGIVSATAWRYLRPYLRDGESFNISRVI